MKLGQAVLSLRPKYVIENNSAVNIDIKFCIAPMLDRADHHVGQWLMRPRGVYGAYSLLRRQYSLIIFVIHH